MYVPPRNSPNPIGSNDPIPSPNDIDDEGFDQLFDPEKKVRDGFGEEGRFKDLTKTFSSLGSIKKGTKVFFDVNASSFREPSSSTVSSLVNYVASSLWTNVDENSVKDTSKVFHNLNQQVLEQHNTINAFIKEGYIEEGEVIDKEKIDRLVKWHGEAQILMEDLSLLESNVKTSGLGQKNLCETYKGSSRLSELEQNLNNFVDNSKTMVYYLNEKLKNQSEIVQSHLDKLANEQLSAMNVDDEESPTTQTETELTQNIDEFQPINLESEEKEEKTLSPSDQVLRLFPEIKETHKGIRSLNLQGEKTITAFKSRTSADLLKNQRARFLRELADTITRTMDKKEGSAHLNENIIVLENKIKQTETKLLNDPKDNGLRQDLAIDKERLAKLEIYREAIKFKTYGTSLRTRDPYAKNFIARVQSLADFLFLQQQTHQ